MITATAPVNLRTVTPVRKDRPTFLALLLRLEAWLDRRHSGNALYSMDERALHDIGLTSADVSGLDRTDSWQSHLMRPAGRR